MPGSSTFNSLTPSEAPDQIDIEVGLSLRRLRRLRRMSQSDLGAAIGVTFQQVQKYERGTNRLSASMLLRAARALNVRAADIFPPDDAPPVPDHIHQFARVRGLEELVAAYCGIEAATERRALLQMAQAMRSVSSKDRKERTEPVE